MNIPVIIATISAIPILMTGFLKITLNSRYSCPMRQSSISSPYSSSIKSGLSEGGRLTDTFPALHLLHVAACAKNYNPNPPVLWRFLPVFCPQLPSQLRQNALQTLAHGRLRDAQPRCNRLLTQPVQQIPRPYLSVRRREVLQHLLHRANENPPRYCLKSVRVGKLHRLACLLVARILTFAFRCAPHTVAEHLKPLSNYSHSPPVQRSALVGVVCLVCFPRCDDGFVVQFLPPVVGV